jgi:hypothetical protein
MKCGAKKKKNIFAIKNAAMNGRSQNVKVASFFSYVKDTSLMVLSLVIVAGMLPRYPLTSFFHWLAMIFGAEITS